jgi:hypothetical protein
MPPANSGARLGVDTRSSSVVASSRPSGGGFVLAAVVSLGADGLDGVVVEAAVVVDPIVVGVTAVVGLVAGSESSGVAASVLGVLSVSLDGGGGVGEGASPGSTGGARAGAGVGADVGSSSTQPE